jgi:TPR repeat protein
MKGHDMKKARLAIATILVCISASSFSLHAQTSAPLDATKLLDAAEAAHRKLHAQMSAPLDATEQQFSEAASGDIKTIKLLLDKGAEINANDPATGWTALMTAAAFNNTDTVQLLLDKGAEINANDPATGWTALMTAAEAGNTNAVKLLLDRGADINAKNNHGNTALMNARQAGKADTVKLLLDWGTGINAKDKNAPLEMLRAKAADGDVKAQVALGWRYYDGEGVDINFIEAGNWFGKAAAQGDAEAQAGLGYVAANNYGKVDNGPEAFQWFFKSAQQGYGIAQFQVANAYVYGDGVTQNKAEAAKWYAKAFQSCTIAAEQGDIHAQRILGLMYKYGDGVAKDPVKAFQWFLKSAQGSVYSQKNLWYAYAEGSGVAHDMTEAAKWHDKAFQALTKKAEHGDNIARLTLAMMMLLPPETNSQSIQAPDSGNSTNVIVASNKPSGFAQTNTDSSGYVTNANLLTPFTVTNSAGEVFTNAVLVKLMPNKFIYKTPGGAMGILRLDSLPEDLLQKIGYDPQAAQATDEAENQKKARQQELAQQQRAFAAQQAELRAQSKPQGSGEMKPNEVPVSTSRPDLEVLDLRAKVTEKGIIFWHWSYQLKVRNNTSQPIDAYHDVLFLDAEGFIIDKDLCKVKLSGGETKTFLGTAIITPPGAERVKATKFE